MTGLDQVVLGFTALVLVVLGALAAAASFGFPAALHWLSAPQGWVEGLLILAVFVLLAAYLVTILLRQKGEPAVVHQAELGTVRILVTTIKGLVAKRAREVEGVKDALVTVLLTEPLQLRVELEILPDFNVPRLAEELQAQVKDYLADTMGIAVSAVEVLVRGIGGSAKPRVS
jgi:uncharacterized alkaline shock family protein YloU